MTLRSNLGRMQGRSETTPEELRLMRRAAWQKQGIIVLDPSEVRDDWTRQAVINEANRLYGRRREGGR